MTNTVDNYNKVIEEIEDYAILLLDENGTIKDWNRGAEKLKGYKAHEIVGKNFKLFYTKEDVEKELPQKLIASAALNGKAVGEGWRVRKDGSRFWGSILITALYDEKNKLTGFLKITRDLTERKSIEEKLRQANEELEQRVKDRTEKLAASEKQFRNTLDNMLEGVQMHDFDWRYIYINDALVKNSSYTRREELMGYTLMEKYPGIEQTDVFAKFKRCMDHRIPEQFETEFTFPNGKKAFFELSVQPVPEGIFILSVDITERKKAEEKLQENIKELSGYKFALDESAIVARTDQKGIIQHVNENFCTISKYSKEELLGQDHRIINSAYHPKEFIRDLWATIANGKIWKGELKNKAKDGTFYWVDTTIVPFLNETGKPYEYLAIRSDITERKVMEEELVKSNRLYAFISGINQSIVHIREPQQLLDKACNIATEIGQFKMAWIGLLDDNNRLNIISAAGDESAIGVLRKYSGIDYDTPLMRDTPTGRTLRTGKYEVNNDSKSDPLTQPWRDEFLDKHEIRSNIALPLKKYGKVVGVFSFYSATENFFDEQEILLLEEAAGDISFAMEVFEKEKLRSAAVAQVVQNETRLKKAQGIAHIGHWELDLATGMGLWSDETCRIYGLDPADNKHSFEAWVSFLHPDDKEYVLKLVEEQRRMISDVSFNHRIIRKDGTIRHIHFESRFEFNLTGKSIGLYGVVLDTTDQRTSEHKLKESEARLNEAQTIAQVGSFEIDMVNNFLSWSDEQYNVLGYKKGEVEPSSELFFSMVHPEDSESVINRFNETFVTFINSSSTFRLISRDGKIKDVFCEWKFAFDHAHKPVRIYGIVQDITERKKAEKEIIKLNQELEARVEERTGELMEAYQQLESFSYTVSHDLRSPLQVIGGYAGLLSKKHAPDLNEDAQRLLMGIKDNVKQMAQLIEDLLNFSRLSRVDLVKKPVDMKALMQQVIEELKLADKAFKAGIKVQDLKTVNGDIGLLHQVCINLVSNAVKYSRKVKSPVVEIGCTVMNKELVFFVKDNGSGFDMKYADKLFVAFQRLHSQSDFEGTGVGLALVHSIITKHGGRIWAESKPGEGATFYFTLPGEN